MEDREQRNQDATLHVGNIDNQVTEELLWEMFSHCGPVERTHVPRDKVTGETNGYAFVEFSMERDADYCSKIMNGMKLFTRQLRVSKASTGGRALDVGANLYVGGLDEQVDENMLNEVFSAFGLIVRPPQVVRDEEGKSSGYAFVSYDNFDSSDAAIQAMNEQFLFNKQVRVMYAFKKGTTERHGSDTERMLAQGIQPAGGFGLAASGANQVPLGRNIMAPPPPPPLLTAVSSSLASYGAPPPPPLQANYGYPPPPQYTSMPPPSLYGSIPPPPLSQQQHGLMPPQQFIGYPPPFMQFSAPPPPLPLIGGGGQQHMNNGSGGNGDGGGGQYPANSYR